MEGCQPRVALSVEDSRCLVALGEFVVLVELVGLVEERAELVDAIVLDSSSLRLLRKCFFLLTSMPVACGYVVTCV